MKRLQPGAVCASLTRYPGVQDFLDASKELAKQAHAADPYKGVVLTDPFDKAEVRWNPARRITRWLDADKWRIGLSVSSGPPKNDGAYKGDHLVHKGELGRKVAPGIIHMLDAFFSGLVMERLVQLGVRDFVALHDCRLVPAFVELKPDRAIDADPTQHTLLIPKDTGRAVMSGQAVLQRVINDVGEAWLCGLERTYTEMLGYLKGTEYEAKVRGWQDVWKRRVLDKNWPRFFVKESELARSEWSPEAEAAWDAKMARESPDLVKVGPWEYIHRNMLKNPGGQVP